MEEVSLSLFDVSTRLGMSPSAIKKRVAHLNIPVTRGARGKLIFDRHAFSLLARADELLKAGQGFEDCRRELGLEARELETPPGVPLVKRVTARPAVLTRSAGASAPGLPTMPAASASDGGTTQLRPLVPPVFIQLGRRKPGAAEAPSVEPDLLARIDSALKLIEDKDKHNQVLQSKLLVAYDEMTKLSATAAAFQERSLNLQHEVQKLQGEMKLLAAPPARKPWWKFWAP